MIETLYSKMHLDSAFELPVETEVAKLELKIGVTLPAEYRTFILGRNGGTFHGVIVPFPNGKSDYLDSMHGINSRTDYAELGEDLNLFTDNHLAKLLPIGGTGMGSLVLMYVGGTIEDGEGAICIQGPFSNEFIGVADSFGEFLNLLMFE